jgi:hypothetical protein
MGTIDIGFDIHPPLTEKEDLAKWDEFLKKVKQHYKNDPNFHETEKYFELKLGDKPKLPKNGLQFMSIENLHFLRNLFFFLFRCIFQTIWFKKKRSVPSDRALHLSHNGDSQELFSASNSLLE